MVLGQDISYTLEIVALHHMTAVVDKISINEKTEHMGLSIGTPAIDPYHNDNMQSRIPFCVEFPNSLKALIAKKTTVKDYWEVWGTMLLKLLKTILLNFKISFLIKAVKHVMPLMRFIGSYKTI